MVPRILVDGRPASEVDALDRGLAFGDGVFRTLRVSAGRPLNWERHFRRLVHDCTALGLAAPGDELLRGEIRAVAPGEATVKIIYTRGSPGRGYSLPTQPAPRRIVAAFAPPDYPPELAREGIRVRRCALVLSDQPRLAGVKSLNRLENVLARAEWYDPQIREGLLCDARGRLIEGTMSNVFLVRGTQIATPDLVRCGVIGAQRERVRALADAAGIACATRDIPFTELDEADEVFLTNSLIGIWPVVSLDGKTWKQGPITRRLQSLISDDDAKAA